MRRILATFPLTALALLALAAPAKAGPQTGDGDGGFSLTPVGNFDTPIHADNAPGTKAALYVVEQGGAIKVIRNGTTLPRPFLDISERVMSGGEQGLFSIAFHPGYKRNRLFYVYFTNNAGDNVLVQFRRAPRKPFVALKGSARRVIRIPHPLHSNHNGGQIAFGPDKLLYLATGDGGGGGDPDNNAQRPDTLLGKVLRINPRKARNKGGGFRPYTSPKRNPYVGRAGRNEVYSLGLRNPFRFSFDALTGAIAIGDVGQGCREEIDYRGRGRARGANFGWSRFEGTSLFNPAISVPNPIGPIHEYDSSHTNCATVPGEFTGVAVIAGHVVRDPRLSSQYGRLLYGDASRNQIRSLIPSEAGASDDQNTGVAIPAGNIYATAEGYQRRLYVVSGNGPVYRLDPAP